ncbi:MAG: DUF424 family protein [Nitrososphaerota archaeon]|nr:DUF424 family protein [Nitrososphaerota archaeon]MCL5672137.1 DUF424 family protein [Nitrososphaerota archaeon]MDG6911878.1 DUF424 family protein [Nitrososphaerota archaeon]MDG6924431.1 DUF424 family protein [Nitrososphaerota archaeon]MDG6941117.1 DUF424 family protein [Nitrososphaerota archaeon]
MAEKGFSVRTAEYRGSILVNICDEELVGRTVAEGNLEVHLSKDFYSGEVVSSGEALRLIRTCSIVNLAGSRSVSLAVSNKVGAPEAIREIQEIPFLMIYKFSG